MAAEDTRDTEVEAEIRDTEMEARIAEISSLETIEVAGETEINDDVIGAIAGIAAREIEGVASLGANSIRRAISERVGGGERQSRGVGVEAGHREAILDIDLRVIYGFSVPDIVIKVRQNVARRVLEMCGLVTKEININVTSIEFTEKLPTRVE